MPDLPPDRASDSGPDRRPDPSELSDWRSWLYVAEENCAAARRMEKDTRFDSEERRNRHRIAAINAAMEALQEAKDLLL